MERSILNNARENFARKISPLARGSNHIDNYKAGLRPDEIIGYWHEDNSPFEIRVPAQLRDIMIEALNNLHLLEFKDDAS